MAKPIEQMGFWKALTLIQKVILVTTSVVAALVIAVGVFMRYVLGKDFFGQEEVVTVIAMWLYWVGGIYGSYEDSHIQADVVSTMMKDEKKKKILRIFVLTVTLIVLVIWTFWSFEYFIWGLGAGAKSTGLKIPLIISQSALMVGFTGMTAYTVYQIVRVFKPRKDLPAEEKIEEGGEA